MLALALSSALALQAPPVRPRALPLTVSVTSPQLQRTPLERPIRATKILELELHAQFPRSLVGDHVMEFDLYTPNGHLYQTLTVPFTGVRRLSARVRPVEGYPRPLLERQMRAIREDGTDPDRRETGASRCEVTARLPVAGTWIVTNSLYGRWRVDVRLDGGAPSGSTHFVLAP
jgi:hypothetical protein